MKSLHSQTGSRNFSHASPYINQDVQGLHALVDRLQAIAADTAPRAIRRPRVLELIGISRSQVYAMLDANSPSFDATFPQPFHLGVSQNSPTVWWENEIIDWLRSKAQARKNSTAQVA